MAKMTFFKFKEPVCMQYLAIQSHNPECLERQDMQSAIPLFQAAPELHCACN